MTDYTLGETFDLKFTTRSFSTGAPTTLGGTPVVSAYPDNSTTELTAGITLTADFDTRTGLNNVRVVATAANGYASGSTYYLVITTGTVGGVSVVGEVVGEFTLGRASAVTIKRIRSATAQAGAAGSITLDASASAVTDFYAGCNIFVRSGTGVGQFRTCTAYNGTTKVATVVPNWATNPDSTSVFEVMADGSINVAAWRRGQPNALVSSRVDASVGAVAANAITATAIASNAITSAKIATDAIGAAQLAADAIGSSELATTAVNEIRDAILADSTAFNGADIAAILTDTGTTLDTKLNDIQGATFSSATDSLEAIRDRGDAAWTTGAGGSDRLLMVDTTIATLATQTSFTLTAGSTDDDAYNNCTIVVEDVSTATQKAVGMVLDYTGSSKTVTLKEALAFTIATTDKVYILAENSLKSTVANRQLDVTATGAAGVDWGNVENPTTAVDLSATDIQLCDTVTTLTGHTAQTGDNFARLGAPAGASVSADIAAVKTETAAILVDTAEIGAAGAGLTDLGGMSAAMKAEVNAEADTALVDAGLDHLVSAAVIGTDIADNSIVARLASKSATADWDSYNNTTDSLEALADTSAPSAATIADAVWDEAQADHVAAGSFGVTATEIADILTDTADMQPKLGTPAGADISADIAAVKTETAAILVDTDTSIPALISGLNDLSAAQVNTEVLDVLNTDTLTLPGQAAPPLAPTHREAIGWLYKVMRNRKTQTATQWSLLADDESTVDAKATLSDDGVTAIKQEIVTGP